MNQWAYQEITSKAKDETGRLMNAWKYQWAHGVYLGWYRLTVGWQDDGDSEYLESLTNAQ